MVPAEANTLQSAENPGCTPTRVYQAFTAQVCVLFCQTWACVMGMFMQMSLMLVLIMLVLNIKHVCSYIFNLKRQAVLRFVLLEVARVNFSISAIGNPMQKWLPAFLGCTHKIGRF